MGADCLRWGGLARNLKGHLSRDRGVARCARISGSIAARLCARAQASWQCLPTTLEGHPEDETFPGLLLLRLEGRVFFANAELIGQKMKLLAE